MKKNEKLNLTHLCTNFVLVSAKILKRNFVGHPVNIYSKFTMKLLKQLVTSTKFVHRCVRFKFSISFISQISGKKSKL